jgi:hypothetical protein
VAALWWCPSCGASHVDAGTCERCGVARVDRAPARRDGRVSVGAWPRLAAQILRARLETAGVTVLAEGGERPDGIVTLAVDPSDAEFAAAVVHELEVDDEVPDQSAAAYVARIEEHLAVVAELLDELRTRVDDLEAGNTGQ